MVAADLRFVIYLHVRTSSWALDPLSTYLILGTGELVYRVQIVAADLILVLHLPVHTSSWALEPLSTYLILGSGELVYRVQMVAAGLRVVPNFVANLA
jgi:hypothetical protein